MIISQTPLRVSFCGGGTDLRAYYQHAPGAVTSTAINKHVYVTVNKAFEDIIRVAYSRTEIVKDVDEIQHELVREALKIVGIRTGVEITTMADVPGKGTGLGSSSSVTVGLLNALYAFRGQHKSAETLAREACRIEIELVGEPIGKQDQYIAAYGGFQHITFNPDETVFVEPVISKKGVKEELQNNLLMFFTGLTRPANTVLSEQKKNTSSRMETLDRMKKFALDARDSVRAGDIDGIGRLLHENWELKKKLAGSISSPEINSMYDKAKEAGAIGGKLLGAGGGGFLLFYARPEKHKNIRKALSSLREMEFSFEPQGSRIIFVGD